MQTDTVVGLDLGQAQDYTALAVAVRQPAHAPAAQAPAPAATYHVRHLRRWPLGTSYPAIVADVVALMARPEVRGAVLAVDFTGVGRPVGDLLVRAGLAPQCVTITGGDAVTREGDNVHVPKRDLVGAVQVLLQGGRLKVAPSLPEAAVLAAELQNFRVAISLAGRDSYGAGAAGGWREGAHDDLVLAVALACWTHEHPPRSRRPVGW